MIFKLLKFTQISLLSTALAFGAGVGFVSVSADMAFAKSDKGKGGGKGGGNGSGNKGGKGKDKSSKGKSKDKSGKTAKKNALGDKLNKLLKGKKTKTAKQQNGSGGSGAKSKKLVKKAAVVTAPRDGTQSDVKALKPRKRPLDTQVAETTEISNGKLRSAMGALNAANASETARANASPNSRVGRIAAYEQAVRDGYSLESDLQDLKTELALLEEPTRSEEEISEEVLAKQIEKTELEGRIAALEEQLNEGDDPTLAAELETAKNDLAANEDTLTSLEKEAEETAAYSQIEADIASKEEAIENRPELEAELIEAAANKPVTQDVLKEVHRLLDLEEPVFEDDVIETDETALLKTE